MGNIGMPSRRRARVSNPARRYELLPFKGSNSRSNQIRQENKNMLDLSTLLVIIIGLYLLSSIKILREYERGVIFRLGRLLPRSGRRGVILVFSQIDRIVRITMRVDTIEVPPQDVVTKDN